MDRNVRAAFRFGSQTQDGNILYYTVFAFLLIIQLGPVWTTTYPPMHDYPNHLARVHILHQYSSIESYRAVYEWDWRLFPNLAIDLIVPPLLNIFSIEIASKIFLSLIIVLFNVGLHSLGAALTGRPHWSALAASFFTYNYSLSYGFVNYMFGLGMFFLTFAAWLRMRAAWTVGRLSLIGLLALLCYFSHLSAFAFLGIAIVCVTALDLLQTRALHPRRLVGLLPLAPTLMVYLIHSFGIEHRGEMVWWTPLIMKKLTGLSYPFVSHNLSFDLALGAAFSVIVLILLVSRVGRLAGKELLLVGSLLVFLYLVSPMSAAQSHYVDRRFIIPAVVMLVLALQIDFSKALGRYLMIGLLVLSIGRVAAVWKFWTGASQELEAQVHMLDLLPDKARLFPMLMYETSVESWFQDAHFYYLPHYATIYRHAFVPNLYALNGVNLVRFSRSLQVNEKQVYRGPRLDEANWDNDYTWVERGTPLHKVKWRPILSKYDYLWGYKLSEEYMRFLLSEGQLVARSGSAVLIRTRKA
jgi:hypothetical protein